MRLMRKVLLAFGLGNLVIVGEADGINPLHRV